VFPLAFYEEQPYAVRATAEALDEAVQAATLAAGVPLAASFVSGPADVEAAVQRKQRLALCYDSQLDDAATVEIAEFSRTHEGRERLWVNAAWGAAGL
jgi:hypothetical protein